MCNLHIAVLVGFEFWIHCSVPIADVRSDITAWFSIAPSIWFASSVTAFPFFANSWVFSIAPTDAVVCFCSPPIMLWILSVASPVCAARLRTSSATTAKPRPVSPALAASIAAFNASKLVCSEMLLMTPTKCWIEVYMPWVFLRAVMHYNKFFSLFHRNASVQF